MSRSLAGDTIVAVASGAGRAAIAVLRLSGPGCGEMLARLCGCPPPRRASLRALRWDGEVLDQALVLWMPGPGSATGEDCAELHLHGGRAVVEAVSTALVQLGARPAEPGEFTRRAVLGGRMDLLVAEGVADLVAAETEAQRRQAMRQMEGGLSRRLGAWAERLRVVLAHQEALIDFPDDDLPPEIEALLRADIEALRAEMLQALSEGAAGERVRDGLVIAVVGAPDVGKSSLVNALAGREVAIVAAGPGTTRDVLEAGIEIAGVPVVLLDTAGLRDTADPVEAEGVRRARARAVTADLVIEVRDARTAAAGPGPRPGATIVLWNKADLGGDAAGLRVSVRSGQGLEMVRARLATEVEALTATGGTPLTRARHRAALQDAAAALERAGVAAWPELRAEDLRLALQAVGRITGAVDVEALLDTVFSHFCVGK